MGCWNGTCAISQLAIKDRDQVKVVFIQNQVRPAEASGYSYNKGCAEPISFTFDAVYNDYGAFENITNDLGFTLFKKYIKLQIKQKNIKILKDYSEDEIDYENFEEQHLIEAIERDRVLTKKINFRNDQIEWTLIGFNLIRKDVFDECSKAIPESLEEDCTFALDLFFNPNESRFQELKEKLKENKDIPEDDLNELLNDLEEINASWKSDIKKSGNWSNSVSILEDYNSVNVQAFKGYFELLRFAPNNSYSKGEIIKLLKEFISILYMMSSLRKSWMGQAGKGSQEDNNETYQHLINAMQQVLNGEEYE